MSQTWLVTSLMWHVACLRQIDSLAVGSVTLAGRDLLAPEGVKP